MAGAMSDDQLRETGLAALEGRLGPVDTLRFLALVRREPFNYETWREKTFAGLTVDELFQRMEQTSSGRS
jgi:hypothetical protein